MSLTKLYLQEKIKLFSARESLVSDIPAEDWKIANLFYSLCIDYHQNKIRISFIKPLFCQLLKIVTMLNWLFDKDFNQSFSLS